MTRPEAQPRVSTVADLIGNAAREFADREAFRSFGVSLTYRELLTRAGRRARTAGVGRLPETARRNGEDDDGRRLPADRGFGQRRRAGAAPAARPEEGRDRGIPIQRVSERGRSRLASHPRILEAVVVAIPDPRTGEAVAASVVHRDPALSEQAILDHCRASLAAYKCPKRIEFEDELPKSVVGKMLRRAVRERWAERVRTPA